MKKTKAREWCLAVQGNVNDKTTWWYRAAGPEPRNEFHDDVLVIEHSAYQELMEIAGEMEAWAQSIDYFKTGSKTFGQRKKLLDKFHQFKKQQGEGE